MLWVVVHRVGEKSYTLICDLAKFQPSWSHRLAAQSLQQLGAGTAPPFAGRANGRARRSGGCTGRAGSSLRSSGKARFSALADQVNVPTRA